MQGDAAEGEQKKKRSFRRFSYRGVDLEQLLELNLDDLLEKFHARARRKCAPGPACAPLKSRQPAVLVTTTFVHALAQRASRSDVCIGRGCFGSRALNESG